MIIGNVARGVWAGGGYLWKIKSESKRGPPNQSNNLWMPEVPVLSNPGR